MTDDHTLRRIFRPELDLMKAAEMAGHTITLGRSEDRNYGWWCSCGAGGSRPRSKLRLEDIRLHCNTAI